ncbi:pentapeptide repeat-containing protein [Tumidithrix elongata RA019]|uniref:Pentapeptide repeat-containing protein n=1 Tax=Tumidithrix elongata BACA0141 TaxID=2716417 RepID=A0AAW9Q3N7_9CYAN|nr:pentapeptide repeat-containing protein [Tumidithrix elongata RA019]
MIATSPQNWPLNIDFTAAVQNPQVCFADKLLKRSQPAKNSRGRITLWSGNFATVYKLMDAGCSWAVRCFIRVPQPDVQQRYAAISEYLDEHQLPYLVHFQFLEQGILVKDAWYPILKMDWVDGVELDRYIGDHLNDPDKLLNLDRELKQLKQDLRDAGIAHGDLQHGNIMVTRSGQLKLVDYDGMYVPALKGIPPYETGHPNYQLPERSLQDFGEQVDDFSFDVISLSLKALAKQPELWDSFHEDNKNLIFRQDDFRQPKESPVFQSIAQINDTETQILYDNVVQRCSGELVYVDRENSRLEFAIEPLTRFVKWLRLDIPHPSEPKHYKRIFLSAGIFVISLSVWLWFRHMQQVRTQEIAVQPTESATPSISRLSLEIEPITREKLLEQYKNGRRDFKQVNLADATLNGVNLSGINLSNSVLERVDLHQADLSGANLYGVTLAKADLRGANLTSANLTDADLTEANLREANLTKALLLRADLKKADLSFAIVVGADLMRANLSEANLGVADLRGTNFVLANLFKANLIKAKLRESNLGAANLTQATLDSADLVLADLRSAELYLTILSSANLSSANLSSANLVMVELAGTNLSGVNFRGITVDNVNNIQDANFANVMNLSPAIRKYFCSSASGTFSGSNTPTKVTLSCP